MEAANAPSSSLRHTTWPKLNDGMLYVDKVSCADEGQNLIEFYTSRYPHSASELGWKHRLARGQVLVAKKVVKDPQVELRQGTLLEYHRLPWQEPDVPCGLPVMYEDNHVLAVSKPSGLQVLPGGPFHQRTALTLLQWWYSKDGPTPAPVHRLGRGTSGVLLCAKTLEAKRALAADFAETTVTRAESSGTANNCGEESAGLGIGQGLTASPPDKRIAKTYRALVRGIIHQDVLAVDQPIGRIKHGDVRGGLHAASPNGKPSRSRIRVVYRDLERDATLVEVDLFTGRPHQIRIHCAASGFPLVGDPLYVEGGVPVGRDARHRESEGRGNFWGKSREGGQAQEMEGGVEPSQVRDGQLEDQGNSLVHFGRWGSPHASDLIGLEKTRQVRQGDGREEQDLPEMTPDLEQKGEERMEMAAVAGVSRGSTGVTMEDDGGHSKGSVPMPGDCGYHLHALRLAFNHPVTKERILVVAPPPLILCAPNESPETLISCSIDVT